MLLPSLVVLEPATMSVMAAGWASIDFDADGKVTLSDLSSGAANPMAVDPMAVDSNAAAYFKKLCKVLDLNNDGKIDKSEFVRGITMKAIEQLEPSQFQSAAFRHVTVPGAKLPVGGLFQTAVNSKVRRMCYELLQTLIFQDAVTKTSMEAAWRVMDHNGDGSVTLSDFASSGHVSLAAASYFESLRLHLDLNGDGAIEKAEFIKGLILKVIEVLDATQPLYMGRMRSEIKGMADHITTMCKR